MKTKFRKYPFKIKERLGYWGEDYELCMEHGRLLKLVHEVNSYLEGDKILRLDYREETDEFWIKLIDKPSKGY